ncbi:ribonuclease J [Helcococcus massiliensis]|uniref:ribonuclease J n=1 Tax=Helcococcus massiliensis TaxID=2040290 RepID=UPI000CDF1A23|nr:ribonuclease J [Helcococcus massiliensis]
MARYYKKKKNQTIKIIPLGGVGEIGKNMTAVEYNNQIFIIDAGTTFPDDSMPGVDIVIQDFTYLEENKDRIKALLITHGHEDHIGAVPYLLKKINTRVYSTRLTNGLIQGKLEEHGLPTNMLKNVSPGQTIRLGDVDVEFISVNHSIPAACAIALHTEVGTILFTGDFKVDYTPIDGVHMDLQRLGELGRQGVLAMLSDSTNVERSGYTMSEVSIRETFKKVFSEAEGRICVATFASNLHRVQQVFDAAEYHKKKIFISGRSMVRNIGIAVELGYLRVKKDTIQDISKINKFKDNEIVMLTTGSQGEQMAALTRMARGDHRQLKLEKGDTVIISASPIPGNEESVSTVINNLAKLGVKTVYSALADVHVSGHASREELKLMLALVRPKYFIPVHGELRHQIMHKELCVSMGAKEKDCFILELGDVLELTNNSAKIVGKVPAGKVLVDGLGIGDVGNIVLKDRQKLSDDGIITASMVWDSKAKKIVGNPQILSRGFVYVKDSQDLMDGAYKILGKLKNEINNKKITDVAEMKRQVIDRLKSYTRKELNRDPIILIMISEI